MSLYSSQVDTIDSWSINNGLSTLEMHRHLPVEIAAKHLFVTKLINDFIIFNAYASEEEL
ncbi:MupG family TIM beta-alpha barrel fold protein [Enterococcus ratti]|uniref:MupG family TIM beta-alpha barrel fold protein n=1 Tax=Enterococcus ratti TaxID=150033 RepID=UPI003511B4B6